MAIRIGIAGWIYPNWRGTFYPQGLAQKKELEYAASKVTAIEINGTFYSMKKPADFAKWSGEVPKDFVFTLKGPRFITHIKKLKDVEAAAANFFASGVIRLSDKLGAILWQFPPQLSFMPERFEPFLELLPKDLAAAASLGEKHNDKLKAPPWLEVPANRPLRHAIEVRHESFLCEEFITLLRKHNVALVIADSAGRYPAAEDITADFVYVRLHGSKEFYASGYGEEELQNWAARIRLWHAGKQPVDGKRISPDSPTAKERNVFVFFDNDAKVHAPFNAQRLAEILKVAKS
jgi:uncharacterized protein YecE (DUF72 family)